MAVPFADIVGFTEYCDTHDPEEVLDALTKITLQFEEISERHGLEKIKTIGDSFMAATGLLSPMLNPDLQCVKAGFDMIAACRDLTPTWSVRLGVHSGDLIAGVLGNKKFLFDVWGDTVNTASRVEATAFPTELRQPHFVGPDRSRLPRTLTRPGGCQGQGRDGDVPGRGSGIARAPATT